MDWSVVALGFAASVAAGIATSVGALPVLFIRRLPEPFSGALLGWRGSQKRP